MFSGQISGIHRAVLILLAVVLAISFVGSADICDYMDFIIEPGKEQVFFTVILDHLKQAGISELYLEALRPDAHFRGCERSDL